MAGIVHGWARINTDSGIRKSVFPKNAQNERYHVTVSMRAALALVLLSFAAPAWCAEATAGGSLDPNSLLGGLTRVKHARTLRVSSWNTTGRNGDAWTIEPGEKRELANLKGPGCITHIWMTQNGPGVLRNVLLKMYWDDEREPSVLAPLGDFFCLGHGITNSFQSLPFATSVREENQNKFNATAGLNCYLPMPFRKAARKDTRPPTSSISPTPFGSRRRSGSQSSTATPTTSQTTTPPYPTGIRWSRTSLSGSFPSSSVNRSSRTRRASVSWTRPTRRLRSRSS